MRHTALFVVVIAAQVAVQTSCVIVGGYSSEGGWYVWPWSLVITAIFVGLWLLWRRRRR